MKRARKTAEMGISTPTLGTPPTEAVVGAYGGPGGDWPCYISVVAKNINE